MMAENTQIEKDQLRENLRRMGCYLILDAYEDLKRWIRPKQQYTQKQLKELEEDPLEEIREFFFGQDGLDSVVEAFEINLNPDTVRRVASRMLEQAEACISGDASNINIPQESWDLLMETITRSHINQHQK